MNKNILRALTYQKINSKQELIGAITLVLYSKDIFPRNIDAYNFINNVFNVNYLDYVIRSRTLLCARLTRNLVEMNEKQVDKTIKELSLFFLEYMAELKEEHDVYEKNERKGIKYKINNEKDLDKWIRGILGKNKNVNK